MQILRHEWFIGPEGMQQEIERLLSYLGSSKSPVYRFASPWEPAVDVLETEYDVIVIMELAGVEENDIQVTVDDRNLIVRGMRRDSTPPSRRRYHRMEIHRGPFEKRIVLPARVDSEKAQASREAGMLHITLPKIQPQTMKIDIKP